MSKVSTDIIQILQYLLPGFLCAWVYYGFTSHKKPREFERVVQALILTLIIQALMHIEKLSLLFMGEHLGAVAQWGTEAELVNSTLLALVVGLILAFLANTDHLHACARRIKITRETSFPSEWYGTFSLFIRYTVLHLNDERRLYGWLKEWPSDARQGHFAVLQPSWLTENGEEQVTGVECILIDVRDVKWVEFMCEPSEKEDGKERIESATSANHRKTRDKRNVESVENAH